MAELWIIILLHQLVFQGMFITKNITLSKKINQPIRGKNVEATISIIYFTFIILFAFIISLTGMRFGEAQIIDEWTSTITGMVLLVLNLIISGAALIHLGDSWRVGVIDNQKTEFITSGIFRYTRNPYFVSYLLMFLAYTFLLQNLILLGLSIIAFFFVHNMILKEEKYLQSEHADAFLKYKQHVPRYLFI